MTQQQRYVSGAGGALFLTAFIQSVKDGYGLRRTVANYPKISSMIKSVVVVEGHEVEAAEDTDEVVSLSSHDSYEFLSRVEALTLAGYELELNSNLQVGDFVKSASFRSSDSKVKVEPVVELDETPEEEKFYTAVELDEKNMVELRAIGQRYDVKDTKKADLIDKILEAQEASK